MPTTSNPATAGPPPGTPDLPDWLADHVVSPAEALRRTVTSGSRIGSGLATSEPPTFYEGLWDHVLAQDLRDLDIRQGLFMAPHPILVGAALDAPRPSLPGPLAGVGEAIGDALALRRLSRHLDALEARGITFTSAFLGPVGNRVVPDTWVTRRLAPRLAGRNRVTAGYMDYQPVHFPYAADALCLDDDGKMTLDLLVQPLSWPDGGRVSFGLSNGVNGDVYPHVLADDDATLLVYLNRQLPFIEGPGHVIDLQDLRPLADAGRLVIVVEDREPPGVPDLGQPDEIERAIARRVADHITQALDRTRGRALQVGIGRISAQVVERLGRSDWTGRGYTEMLDPATYALLENGTITGSHIPTDDGGRTPVDGLVCTFAMGERGSDFSASLDHDQRVQMLPASRLLQPRAFNDGLGINNILAIDLAGNVNATARDLQPYSAVGGLATIMRGLADGGIAYLCMKSTHRGPDGKPRSSIMPTLVAGTPVTLTLPDLLSTRNRGQILLATEFGVVALHGVPQPTLIRRLLSIAHPDHRAELAEAAWRAYRVSV